MYKFLPYKKKLIQDVFKKAKNSTAETSFTGILKDLENSLRDDFNIYLSYKSFETYYRIFIEKNEDYKIKSLILNDLSKYLGFENFDEYCEKNRIKKDFSNIKINIDENEEEVNSDRNFSDINISITNSPVFNFPEFVTRHKNSFGIAGILLVAGFIFNKNEFFNDKKEEISQPLSWISESNKATETSFVSNDLRKENNPPKIVFVSENKTKYDEKLENTKRKDCMYWNDVEYIPVFCDENLENFKVIQINSDVLKIKKITRPDTLTTENAIGKVWYDKSNKKVEFFTHHGIHPENGKTLRNVTEYIVEKYAK